MYGAYIARIGDGRVFSFYHTRENGICQKVWEKGRWGGALSVAVDARPGFEAAFSGGRFYILYQDREGFARMISSGGDGGFVAENLPLGWEFRGCALVPSRKGLRLFYEDTLNDGPHIFSARRNGPAWEGYTDVDSHSGGFCAQVVNDDHGVLFYQRIASEPSFGYREFTLDRDGEYHPVNLRHVFGYSCLTTPDSIHFLYSVRTMMGYRLCYRKLCNTGLTASVTVHDGLRHENCLLFITGGRIYACFIYGGQPYICESDNDGRSFKAAERYKRKFCQLAMKAGFISGEADTGDLAAREVYVDSASPWDVQMLPDLYEDFYASPELYSNQQKEDPHQAVMVQPENTDELVPGEAELAEMYYGFDISDESKMRNQFEMMERKNMEKERHLESMETLMKEMETQRSLIERLYEELQKADKKDQ